MYCYQLVFYLLAHLVLSLNCYHSWCPSALEIALLLIFLWSLWFSAFGLMTCGDFDFVFWNIVGKLRYFQLINGCRDLFFHMDQVSISSEVSSNYLEEYCPCYLGMSHSLSFKNEGTY